MQTDLSIFKKYQITMKRGNAINSPLPDPLYVPSIMRAALSLFNVNLTKFAKSEHILCFFFFFFFLTVKLSTMKEQTRNPYIYLPNTELMSLLLSVVHPLSVR